jgi:predicted RNA-binding protein YlxR (DUF448 family)
MYEKLEQTCKKCGSTTVEILDYVEVPDSKYPKAIRAGWLCISCNTWEQAILRERVAKEKLH